MTVCDTPAPVNAKAPETVLPEHRTPSDVAALLKRPFAAHVIKQRKVAGRDVDYVAIGDVIDRLNRACMEWHWQVTDIRILTMPLKRRDGMVDTPVAHVTGTLVIPGLGQRQAVGTAPCEGTEDAAKAAESDAIKRAATMFGVPGGR